MYKKLVLIGFIITSNAFGGLEETIAQYLAKNNVLLEEQNKKLEEIKIAIKALAAVELQRTGDLSDAMARDPKSAFHSIVK